MLEKEFAYFRKNHEVLYNRYPDKYLVIEGDTVLYAADTLEEAVGEAVRRGLEQGRYLVQLCSKGEDAYTQTFHSRVVFA